MYKPTYEFAQQKLAALRVRRNEILEQLYRLEIDADIAYSTAVEVNVTSKEDDERLAGLIGQISQIEDRANAARRELED